MKMSEMEFANTLAAKRLLSAVGNLPTKLKDELRSALEKGKDINADASLSKKRVVSSLEDIGRAQVRVEDTASRR